MGTIEKYRAAKARAERFRAILASVTRSDCDKFGATVKLTDTYKGYFGSSSCSSWDDELVKAVCIEIQSRLKDMIRAAAQTAEQVAERARKDAEAEAREVLGETVKA